MLRKIDNNVIQVEGEIYWEVDTIAFRFYWTIIRTMRIILEMLSQRWMFKNAKYKNLGENLSNKKKLPV